MTSDDTCTCVMCCHLRDEQWLRLLSWRWWPLLRR